LSIIHFEQLGVKDDLGIERITLDVKIIVRPLYLIWLSIFRIGLKLWSRLSD